MIESGELRTRVDIENPTVTTVAGKTSRSWPKLGNTRHCQLVKQTSREFVFAKETNSTITHLVRMRFTADVNSARRLKLIDDGNRVLNIVGVDNVRGLNREMLVSCKEDATAVS